MATLDSLEDVEYYTALDPYYYTVDNRPLVNLDNNIQLIAAATDASAGNADRAALAAATAAYALIGYGETVSGDPIRQSQGMFSSAYTLSGLQISFLHGYLVHPVDQGGSPAYVEPILAIHDSVTELVAQAGRGCTIQATYADATDDSRVPSSDSPIQVVTLSLKQGSSAGTFPLPDTGNISIMHIDVPTSATELSEDDIELINMSTIEQTSNVLDQSVVQYITYDTTLTSGSQNISLTGSDIDTDQTASLEVFLDGVNQFEWAYNESTNNIVLAAAVTADASARVRQTIVSLI